jgi:H-NS histone C-terminal domain
MTKTREDGFTDLETGTFLEAGMSLRCAHKIEEHACVGIAYGRISVSVPRSSRTQKIYSFADLQEWAGLDPTTFWEDWSYVCYAPRTGEWKYRPMHELRGQIVEDDGPFFGEDLGEPWASKESSATKATSYRHPEDDTLTWSGRGRRPLWLNELLAQGVELAALRTAQEKSAA